MMLLPGMMESAWVSRCIMTVTCSLQIFQFHSSSLARVATLEDRSKFFFFILLLSLDKSSWGSVSRLNYASGVCRTLARTDQD
jgi:hypothetical protein